MRNLRHIVWLTKKTPLLPCNSVQCYAIAIITPITPIVIVLVCNYVYTVLSTIWKIVIHMNDMITFDKIDS